MLEKVKLYEVKGFNPADYLVDYTDEETGEVKKRLPFAAQITWFRLVFPNGKIDTSVECENEEDGRFIARAKVYSDFNLPEGAFLASAEQSRRFMSDKPRISPRVAAETAAVSLALRYAGFGCQYDLAGDEPEPELPTDGEKKEKAKKAAKKTAKEINDIVDDSGDTAEDNAEEVATEKEVAYEDMTPEDAFEKACAVGCTSGKYAGKTLGEVLHLNPGYIDWVVKKVEDHDNPIWKACNYISARAKALAG